MNTSLPPKENPYDIGLSKANDLSASAFDLSHSNESPFSLHESTFNLNHHNDAFDLSFNDHTLDFGDTATDQNNAFDLNKAPILESDSNHHPPIASPHAANQSSHIPTDDHSSLDLSSKPHQPLELSSKLDESFDFNTNSKIIIDADSNSDTLLQSKSRLSESPEFENQSVEIQKIHKKLPPTPPPMAKPKPSESPNSNASVHRAVNHDNFVTQNSPNRAHPHVSNPNDHSDKANVQSFNAPTVSNNIQQSFNLPKRNPSSIYNQWLNDQVPKDRHPFFPDPTRINKLRAMMLSISTFLIVVMFGSLFALPILESNNIELSPQIIIFAFSAMPIYIVIIKIIEIGVMRTINTKFKREVVYNHLLSQFDRVEYIYGAHTPIILKEINYFVQTPWTNYKLSDLIRAEYHGCPFRYYDIRLRDSGKTPVFSGQYIVCQMPFMTNIAFRLARRSTVVYDNRRPNIHTSMNPEDYGISLEDFDSLRRLNEIGIYTGKIVDETTTPYFRSMHIETFLRIFETIERKTRGIIQMFVYNDHILVSIERDHDPFDWEIKANFHENEGKIQSDMSELELILNNLLAIYEDDKPRS